MNKVKEHNRTVRANAEFRAKEMQIYPSKLEEKMQKYLDEHNIKYETQKIFYICADDGWIMRYYIADFYIPGKQIIIEVDGKFHEKQRQHDKMRTRTIQEHYPEVEVLRYTWGDMSDLHRLFDLLKKVG